MTVIGFCSAKHSPGVTTSALAFATALGNSALLIEADLAGGDLAANLQLSTEMGLLSAMAAARNAAQPTMSDHVQVCHGRNLLLGPSNPIQMEQALNTAGVSVVTAAKTAYETVLLDLGRLPSRTAHPLMALVDHLVVVLRPTLNAVDHVRSRLELLPESAQVLVVGDRPYSPVEVASVLNRSLNTVLPDSQRDVELLLTRPGSRSYLRSAFSRISTDAATSFDSTRHTQMASANTDRLVS